jgi:sugar phosphate isomerase/epimerase
VKFIKPIITRRSFIQKASLASLAIPAMGSTSLSAINFAGSPIEEGKRKIHVFSKHLHWLDYKHMAEFVAECGFDGADITVRKDGHVEPARVVEDLPKVVEAMKKAGKEVTMITTSILKAEDPNAYAILKTAGRLGIKYYRMGWYDYMPDKSVDYNFGVIDVELQKLVALNKQFKIKGAYQNHAGDGVGSAVWDIGMLLKKINSPWLGMQYDIRHATVEGPNSWPTGYEYVKPYINTLDIKDFTWQNKDGKWAPQNVPLGEGVVNFDKYFSAVKTLSVEIPMCLHFEYPIGGAEHGAKTISLDAKEVMDIMKKDLAFVRERV